MLGDPAGFCGADFDVPAESEFPIEKDPKPSEGGLFSWGAWCYRVDSELFVDYTGRCLCLVALSCEVYHLQLFWCKSDLVVLSPSQDGGNVFREEVDVFV